MSLFFGAWRGCDCTDVQESKAAIPERCPCHDTAQLGVRPVETGVSTSLGHVCDEVVA